MLGLEAIKGERIIQQLEWPYKVTLNSDRSTLLQREGPGTKGKGGHHQKNKRPPHSGAVLNISFENPRKFSGFNKKVKACP